MKGIIITVLSIIFLALALVSCNNSNNKTEADSDAAKVEQVAKEMLNKIKDYTDLAVKASTDGVISEDELSSIQRMEEEFEKFQEELEEKAKKDPKEKEAIDKYMKKEEYTLVFEEYYEAMAALYKCEGAGDL